MTRLWNQTRSLLDLLDEGLRLYRRGFVRYTLLTAIWLLPLAVSVGLGLGFEDVLIVLLTLAVSFPLAIYLVLLLSRTTLADQAAETLALRGLLAVNPLHLLGMIAYGMAFLIAANIVITTITYCIICPGIGALVFVLGGTASAVEDSAIGGGLMVILIVLTLMVGALFYIVSAITSGAAYTSLIYGLQPFVQERQGFGAAVQRSIDMVFYRFGFNLLFFLLSSTVFGAVTLSVTVGIGVLVPLPLFWLLGEESPLAQGLSVAAWIVGLLVVVPPLPIWMTLFYQRNAAAREGTDLAARIAGLSASPLEHETTQDGA